MDLLESPFLIGLSGALVVSVLGAIWWHTGSRAMLIATLAVIAITIGGVLIERQIETPRESLIRTLHEIAAQIDGRDPAELLEHIHSSRRDLRDRARAELDNYQITDGRITEVYEVTVDSQHNPPHAVARFNASVRGGLRSGQFGDRAVVRHFVVTFQQEGGRWKVVEYEHHDPRTPMMKTREAGSR